MRFAMFAAVGAALLAGCGGKTQPAPAASASVGAARPAACAGVLPITGLCPDAGMGVFGKISAAAELQQPGCVWKTLEAQRTPEEVLVLRGQDCSAAGGTPFHFWFSSPKELHYSEGKEPGKADPGNLVALVLDVAAGETAEDVSKTMLAEAPAAERAVCAPRAVSGLLSGEQPVAGRPFQLEPDEATLAKMHKAEDGPISACGPYGYAEDFQELWEGRASHAIYHSLGQDTAPWDPMSFTFYRRDASGAWAKLKE